MYTPPAREVCAGTAWKGRGRSRCSGPLPTSFMYFLHRPSARNPWSVQEEHQRGEEKAVMAALSCVLAGKTWRGWKELHEKTFVYMYNVHANFSKNFQNKNVHIIPKILPYTDYRLVAVLVGNAIERIFLKKVKFYTHLCGHTSCWTPWNIGVNIHWLCWMSLVALGKASKLIAWAFCKAELSQLVVHYNLHIVVTFSLQGLTCVFNSSLTHRNLAGDVFHSMDMDMVTGKDLPAQFTCVRMLWKNRSRKKRWQLVFLKFMVFSSLLDCIWYISDFVLKYGRSHRSAGQRGERIKLVFSGWWDK